MNRLSPFFTFVILFTLIQVLAADAPDSGKEDFLHKIYQNYNSAPTNQAMWQKVLTGRKSESYNVAKGDTLWDISKTLFGDGFFWSKVWSLNPYITNPHQISMGQRIQFFPGVGLQPPSLDINASVETGLASRYKPFTEKLPPSASFPPLDISDVKLPATTYKYPPALEQFPSSLPDWKFMVNKPKSQDLLISSLRKDYGETELSLTYFISEISLNSIGEIVEIEKEGKTAGERDFVFIEPNDKIKIGAKYTVVKSLGSVDDPDGECSPDMVEVQGELEIVAEIDGYYKALVTRALVPIERHSDIIMGTIPKFNMSTDGQVRNLVSTVMGGDFDRARNILGLQSIIFFNKGTKDGLKKGNLLNINANHIIRNSESRIDNNTWKVGMAKLVRVEENCSTGIILDSNDDIRPGDFTGLIKASKIQKQSSKTEEILDDNPDTTNE